MGDNQPELENTDIAELLEHVGEEFLPAERWPQTLADFVAVLEAHFRRRWNDPDQALTEARLAVAVIAEYMGGQQLYLPRGDTLRVALRDLEIWHRFDGRNKHALARRYEITPRQVESIISRQKALHATKLQGRLFEG